MPYEPTQGVIEDGRIIEAADLLNEFTAISIAIKENSVKSESDSAEAKQAAIKHSDDTLSALSIDGGTF